jgi:hypothetical protein
MYITKVRTSFAKYQCEQEEVGCVVVVLHYHLEGTLKKC